MMVCMDCNGLFCLFIFKYVEIVDTFVNVRVFSDGLCVVYVI